MADEPTLPSLPKVSWNSHTQTFTNTRKRNRNGTTPQPLFSNSSDPAVFSSDDDPHIDNYVEGRHHKKRYIGSWFQQMPASSDSTFSEAVGPQPKPNRTFERQLDSGVWMGSDELSDPADDEDFTMGIDPPPKLKLPQSRNPRPAPSLTPEQMVLYTRIDASIEEGNPNVDLSSLGVTTIPDGPISRLAELALIPSVDKDVPFEQVNPELGLYLSNNRLTRAPGAVFNLEYLTYLSLRNNKISELPPSISNLRNLRELNLSFNRLRYLPGELLSLLKFPSALSSLLIHPNPFHRPNSHRPPRPESDSVVHDDEGNALVPPGCISLFEDDTVLISPDDRPIEEIRQGLRTAEIPYTWQVLLLARTPVQYSDSRGLVLSRFRLPCKKPDGHAQSIESKEEQHVTLQTESVSALSVPHVLGRVSGVPVKSSRVLSLFELALKSASRAAQTWDLSAYLPPQAPSSVLQGIERIATQSSLNGNLGTVPCSMCGRPIITPLTQWIEWWDIAKREHKSWPGEQVTVEPLSMNANENAIPFLKRGCSWNCTPARMQVGQCAPGSLLLRRTAT
ncbi:hypothetical protein F5X97DRAFT_133768 [Nemania serpens]|nr:hypothetical protein F5X97DRAFT_133768 [Nemania serpens]